MKTSLTLLAVLCALAALLAVARESDVPVPAHMTSADLAGELFTHEDMVRNVSNGNTTLDITSLKSSDGKFASGLYRSGKVRAEIDEPYGVDEFMYFLEGGVTLTSADGTVQVIEAGEAVTIPKEWTGVWDTDGYTKIWVIYSADGSGL